MPPKSVEAILWAPLVHSVCLSRMITLFGGHLIQEITLWGDHVWIILWIHPPSTLQVINWSSIRKLVHKVSGRGGKCVTCLSLLLLCYTLLASSTVLDSLGASSPSSWLLCRFFLQAQWSSWHSHSCFFLHALLEFVDKKKHQSIGVSHRRALCGYCSCSSVTSHPACLEIKQQ